MLYVVELWTETEGTNTNYSPNFKINRFRSFCITEAKGVLCGVQIETVHFPQELSMSSVRI